MRRLATFAIICLGVVLYGWAVHRHFHHAPKPMVVATPVESTIALTQGPVPCDGLPPPRRYIVGTVHTGDKVSFGPSDGLICIAINQKFTKACFQLAKGEANGNH